MRIMVVNDDGIESDGIRRLAGMAAELGEVSVVAPQTSVQRHVPLYNRSGKPACQRRKFPCPRSEGIQCGRNSRRLCEGGDKDYFCHKSRILYFPG